MSISDLRKQKWETGGVLRCLDFILRAWRDMGSCETGQEIKSVCPAFIPVTEQHEGGQREGGHWWQGPSSVLKHREEEGPEGWPLGTHSVTGSGEKGGGKRRVGEIWSGPGVVVLSVLSREGWGAQHWGASFVK